MNKINLKTRLQHKPFLVAIFSGVMLLIQQITAVFGYDFTLYTPQITDIFNTVLGILVILGVVVDPTTKGISDSDEILNKNNEDKGDING